MNRPTIADLAKAANVGVSTVDRVLNGRDPVRPQTAEQVLQAAERIGFHGLTAIRRRIEKEKPVLRFGFLLKQSHRKLYQMWAETLSKAATSYRDAHGRAVVRFVDELAPENTAIALLALSREVDAIGVITSDHAQINHAIDGLESEGIPVFTMISDLTAPGRAGYVGNDNVKKGRTAAWFVRNMSRAPGKVAVFVGSHRYLSQDLCEMGFRSDFRENGAEFQMMETMVTLEEPEIGYQLTRDLIQSTPDLVGLYVAGGGITGVMRALREDGGPVARKIVVVAHELTNETRAGLADGIIKVVLSHPARLLADTLVGAMAEAVSANRSSTVVQHILPFEIFTAANI
ncbi:LacI family transcriptional regulator [Agrobacterium rhizogenes]|uniref:LacI family DNA-binding transcriptional regulator n=1 Tax=Rhizobium rhizogenes TaxID=359 RepID=UPI0015726CC7|nr:LacI family DNA-binding transcriptional regulator [Rhizobium rhizogenes]NTH16615.1 LacI family transcriptional regulator [Rhizobium rhizogenes]